MTDRPKDSYEEWLDEVFQFAGEQPYTGGDEIGPDDEARASDPWWEVSDGSTADETSDPESGTGTA